MKLSSVVALFSIAISALGEKSAPDISDSSTAEAALTLNFSALSQNALNQLSSLAQKSSVYLADTAISACQASKSRLTSIDYDKLSTDTQEKFREVQDGVLTIDYNKLSTDVQEKLREVQEGVLAIDYNKLSTNLQEKLREVQDGVLVIDYDKLSTDLQEKFREAQDGVLAIDYKHLPTDVTDWIIAHPYQTAFHVVGGVVFFAPGLVSTPLLGALGWTSVGPRAGTILTFWDLH